MTDHRFTLIVGTVSGLVSSAGSAALLFRETSLAILLFMLGLFAAIFFAMLPRFYAVLTANNRIVLAPTLSTWGFVVAISTFGVALYFCTDCEFPRIG